MLRIALMTVALLVACAIIARPEIGSPTPRAPNTATGSIAWDPLDLAFASDCATSIWRVPRATICIFDLALDESGDLHVFMAQHALRAKPQGDQAIQHLVIAGNEVRTLPAIQTEKAGPTMLRATAAPAGGVRLVWAEQEYFAPKYHRAELYVQTWRAGAWGARLSVLDEGAQPMLLAPASFSLVEQPDGALDLFWMDYREHHVVESILTMGEGGEYAKVYHRRHTDAGWSAVERVQPHGRTEPISFIALRNGAGPPDVIWSRGTGSDASIVRTAWSGRKWVEKETIGKCHSPLGESGIYDLVSDTGVADATRIAWSCLGYEWVDREAGTNDSFESLFVSSLVAGSWKSGPEISHYGSSAHWLWAGPERSLLLVQEHHERWKTGPASKPIPILIKTIAGNQCVATDLLTDSSVMDTVASAASTDGTVHVIYAAPTSATEAIMKYRRGKYVDD